MHLLVWLQASRWRTIGGRPSPMLPRLSTLGIAGKGRQMPRGQLLSPRHLTSPRNMRKLIPLQKNSRRARSEARNEAGPIGGPITADPVALRPTESTPDLGIGPSTMPTSGLPVSGSQESNSTQTCFFWVIHLIALSCITQPTTPPLILSARFSSQEKGIAQAPPTTQLIQERHLRVDRTSSPSRLPEPGSSSTG